MKLFPHQEEAVTFFRNHRFCLLADEMGLGKTLSTLSALAPPALVVCPAVMKGAWKGEAEKIGLGHKTEILSGRAGFRAPKADEILVVNYDILPAPPPEPVIPRARSSMDLNYFTAMANSIFKTPLLSAEGPFAGAGTPAKKPAEKPFPGYGFSPETTLVLDECHMLRKRRTKMTRTIAAMRKEIAQKRGRVWALSGTPMLNSPMELYTIFETIGIADQVFGSLNRFFYLFGGKKVRKGRFSEWVFEGPKEGIDLLLKRAVLRRLRKDVVDLPEKLFQAHEISLSSKLEADFDELSRIVGEDSAFTAEDLEQAMHGRDAIHIAKIRAEAAREKIPFALEMVENFEDSDEPLVVFSAHREPVEEIGKRPGWEIVTGEVTGKKRDDAVRRFQQGDARGIALTTLAGGVGITLTRACHALFVDRTWVPMLDVQAEDRLHRIGQKNTVTIHSIVSDHPIEKRLEEIVSMKRALFQKTFGGFQR